MHSPDSKESGFVALRRFCSVCAPKPSGPDHLRPLRDENSSGRSDPQKCMRPMAPPGPSGTPLKARTATGIRSGRVPGSIRRWRESFKSFLELCVPVNGPGQLRREDLSPVLQPKNKFQPGPGFVNSGHLHVHEPAFQSDLANHVVREIRRHFGSGLRPGNPQGAVREQGFL